MEISFKFYGVVLALCALLNLFNAAHASGFALIELNASGQGNAYAGAAAGTNNASTVYFNPSGMMRLDSDQLVIAGHFIEPSSSFSNNGSSLAPIYATALAPPPLALTGEDDNGGCIRAEPVLGQDSDRFDEIRSGGEFAFRSGNRVRR